MKVFKRRKTIILRLFWAPFKISHEFDQVPRVQQQAKK